MPYVFSKTAQAMGQGDDKADIFSQGGNQQGGSSKPKGLGLTGGGGESIGAPPVSDAGIGTQKQGLNLTSGAAAQNMAGMNQPGAGVGANVFSDVGAAINQKTSDLQQEANKYANTAGEGAIEKQGYPSTDEADIEKSVKSGNYGALYDLLHNNYQGNVGEYKSGVSTEGIQIPKTQELIASTLQRKSGPSYTKGMSRLDAALLSKSQPFQQEMENLQSQKGAIEADRAAKEKALTEQERGQAGSAYKEKQDTTRAALQRLRENLLNSQNPEKEAFLANKGRSVGTDDAGFRSAMDQVVNNMAAKGTTIAHPEDAYSRLDPNKYYSNSGFGDYENLQSYLDPEEFKYYGNLSNLLDMNEPGAMAPVGINESYDLDAMEKDLFNSYYAPDPGVNPEDPTTYTHTRGPETDPRQAWDTPIEEANKVGDAVLAPVGGTSAKPFQQIEDLVMAPVNAVKGAENTRKKIAKMF